MDGLSMKVVKPAGQAICTPLSHVLDLSIDQSIFLEKLKCSHKVPVFKGTVSPDYKYLEVISIKSPFLEHITPDI